nr:LOW QUALITY PROTEIN: melanoma-associated antigen B5-like [Loxodonta africana]
MPRSRKNKPRKAREKHHQAQGDTQEHDGAQATTAVEEESLSSPSPLSRGAPQGPSADEPHSTPRGPQRAPSSTSASADISCRRLNEDANSQDEDCSNFLDTESSRPDHLAIKVGLLEQFLLYKYKMKQPITKADMLKIVSQKYKDRFSEILKRAAAHIEIMFAVDVKEVDSATQNYALVSKLDLPNNGRVRAGRGLPKTGLLMTLLGVILLKGNCATEKEIWEFLNMMRVFAGRKHLIYGEPRKLITKDLVKLKYLEYRPVPNSDPPRYEFLWGPRAHAETSKIKILEFLAKVNDIVPSALSSLYEEAVRGEKESWNQTYSQGWPYCHGQCLSRAMCSSFSHPLLKAEIFLPSSLDNLTSQ